MRKLLPLILIVILAVACSNIPTEAVSVSGNKQGPIITSAETIAPSATSTFTPLQTPTPTISLTETPSLTPFPTSTLPPDCGTTKLGKSGTQTKESNHSILIEGTAILCNHGSLFEEFPKVIPLREAMLDLDSGLANIESADIGFGVSGTMNFYGLQEINDAQTSLWSLNGLTGEHAPQPTFDQCKELDNSYNNDNEPEYVCVITNEGHIARVKLEKYNPVQQISSVEISFITWAETGHNP